MLAFSRAVSSRRVGLCGFAPHPICSIKSLFLCGRGHAKRERNEWRLHYWDSGDIPCEVRDWLRRMDSTGKSLGFVPWTTSSRYIFSRGCGCVPSNRWVLHPVPGFVAQCRPCVLQWKWNYWACFISSCSSYLVFPSDVCWFFVFLNSSFL